MSMLRSVLTYMGLGPDEDYDDGYLYDASDVHDEDERTGRTRRTGDRSRSEERTIDLRDEPDPHSQRRRPDWLSAPEGDEDEVEAHDGDDDDQESDSRTRAAVRPLRAVPPSGLGGADGVSIRAVTAGGEPVAETRPRMVKPRALSPTSFADAKVLADDFKDGVPVIMNLQGVERDLARRLIDFASGICYALDGGMEKVAPQVFLLTPTLVEVSDEERQRLEQRGYR